MDERSPIPIGVCVCPDPPLNAARTVGYPHYIHEILTHAGMYYVDVPADDLEATLPRLSLLVTVGEWDPSDEMKRRLWGWITNGGAWLSIGGVWGMTDLLGVEPDPPSYQSWGGGMSTLGEGYLDVRHPGHPALAHVSIPLHYFNGVPVHPTEATVLAGVMDAHQRPTERGAVLERSVGAGRCMLIAPDVTGTVVRIQQGIAVTRDGVPSPDGTAPSSDGVLKSGDGGVLDWLLDRQPLEGAPGLSAFLHPVADQWRELVLRAIFYLATRQRVPLPVLWLYPRNLPALAHLSDDTDNNHPERALRFLDVLRRAQVHSTWCVVLPGYPPDVLQAIRSAGHELAMHYDAMSPGRTWGEISFDQQWRELTKLFNDENPITNKNHYLRWEGDTEFFDWCVARGIRMDQSKGAAKTGEAGFNFGTCHPHFPVAPDGRLIPILELPTLTQDLIVFAPEALAEPLLQAGRRQHGIVHFLFHPEHVDKPGVADALRRVIDRAR
ncbi:MAG: hypothetical protein J7M34_09570, partial [Anaerolineae bacterium]|nr:hypothetical protein [Anaerolineae bacterium]